jgi:TolB protein
MRSTNRVFGLSVALIFSIFSLVAGAGIAEALTGQTTRVSVSSAGVPANAGATSGVLSQDGRYVVFMSSSWNLVTGVSGAQVYRHDRLATTNSTELVSVATSGRHSAGFNLQPTVSADGRFVAFGSFGSDLVAGDTNGFMDVFVRDMQTGTTSLVSANADGVAGNGSSGLAGMSGSHGISDDGRYIAFMSAATNLVPEANNSRLQVYVKDTTTGQIVRASVNDAGQAGNQDSQAAAISGNGRVVAFHSASTNLSPLSNTTQVFVRDLAAGTTTLESAGAAAVGRPSTLPALSFDGQYLAFESAAPLDPRDRDNGTLDVFLRDRTSGTTVLASLSDNAVGGATSAAPSISGDGRWVGFHSLDDQLIGVSSDTNGFADVFLYDRVDRTVTLISLNDADVQAIMPSFGASVSSDGQLVLFGSTASNLVPLPSSTGNQLYVRSLASSVAPTVNLASALDLTFTRTLATSGTFSDPDLGETYSATVNYGDGTGTQELELMGGSFMLHHTYADASTYTVTVTVSDSNGGSTPATIAVNVGGYGYEWLDPIGSSFTVGRNLPVKFTVRGPNGAFVHDRSVQVDVVDWSGEVMAGPYTFGDQPSRSVVVSGDTYHVNVDTRDLTPGMYWLRVQFSSPTLDGEFTLATNGTASAVRSRLRD